MADIRAVGLDLGSATWAVSWIDPSGRPARVGGVVDDTALESCVWLGDDEVLVAAEARRAAVADPERFCTAGGSPLSPVEPALDRGVRLPPKTVAQALLLRAVHADVVARLGPDVRYVVAVPGAFLSSERYATLDACRMANLPRADVINSGTAAALAFAARCGDRDIPRPSPRRVVFFDLGAGHIELTLAELGPGMVRIVASGGRAQLGGADWTNRLAAHLGANQPAGGNRTRVDWRMMAAAEELKRSLSARGRASTRIDNRSIEMTRDEFERLTADLLERVEAVVEQWFEQVDDPRSKVDECVALGGAARMPAVRAMLERLCGRTPAAMPAADRAVADGAAIEAMRRQQSRAGRSDAPVIHVATVATHDVGVERYLPDEDRRRCLIVLRRGAPLPAEATATVLTSRDGQRTLDARVYEGTGERLERRTEVCRLHVRRLPATLPGGWPIDLKLRYDTAGRLSAAAEVRGVQAGPLLECQFTGCLSAVEVSRWQNVLAGGGGLSTFADLIASSTPSPRSTTAVDDDRRSSADDEQHGERAIRPAGGDSARTPDRGGSPASRVFAAAPPTVTVDQPSAAHANAAAEAIRRAADSPRRPFRHVGWWLMAAALLVAAYYGVCRMAPAANVLGLPLPGVARPPAP